MELSKLLELTLPALTAGVLMTIKIFVLVLIFSIPLGFCVALLKISKIAPVRWLASTYVWILRGTPLILQIFFIYFGLPFIGGITKMLGSPLTFDNFTAVIIAFSLNYAAYFAEIFRAGIESIDKGQYEGAKALGFTSWQTMKKVIIPQMVRLVLPPVSNETITLVKDTALVSVVALVDLMRATSLKVAAMGNVAPFMVAAVFYLIMTLILTIIFRNLEKRLYTY